MCVQGTGCGTRGVLLDTDNIAKIGASQLQRSVPGDKPDKLGYMILTVAIVAECEEV